MIRAARLAAALGLATPCAWALSYLLPPLNGDVAAILYFADRMLAGDRLYVDLVDVNPPLIFWLNLAPAWLARALDVSAATTFVALVLLLHAASFALCRDAFRRLRECRTPFAQIAVPLAALFGLLILPGENFGQRGHLMVVLALPYLTVSALRLQGDPPRPGDAVLAGLMAGLGFLIKPYFLVIPLAIEVLLLVRHGWRAALARPEPATLALAGLAYASAALALYPSYFNDVLPLVAKYYLTPSSLQAIERVFGIEGRWIGLLALMPVAALALDSRARPALQIALLAAVAGAVIAVVQGKGWPYHLLPFWQATGVAGALALGALLDGAGGLAAPAHRRLAAVGVFAAVSGVLVAQQAQLDAKLGYADSLAGRLQSRLAHLAADRPVLWLTDAIYPHYPVVLYDRARPAMAPMGLWLLDSFYGTRRAEPGPPVMRRPTDMSADERTVFDTVGTALERTHPSLVLVASAAAEFGLPAGSFDYLAYFLRHPSFAREWQHYREVAEIDGTRIFQREDTQPAHAGIASRSARADP